jgi:hypothetical protein
VCQHPITIRARYEPTDADAHSLVHDSKACHDAITASLWLLETRIIAVEELIRDRTREGILCYITATEGWLRTTGVQQHSMSAAYERGGTYREVSLVSSEMLIGMSPSSVLAFKFLHKVRSFTVSALSTRLHRRQAVVQLS